MSVNVFSMSLQSHMIFCGVAVAFFILQFVRTKRVYELILAVAVLASLLVYVTGESTALFYAVGVLEGVLLIAALIASIVQDRAEKKKQPAAPKTEEQNA